MAKDSLASSTEGVENKRAKPTEVAEVRQLFMLYLLSYILIGRMRSATGLL